MRRLSLAGPALAAALALAPALAPVLAPVWAAEPEVPVLDGAVEDVLRLDEALLRSFPPVSVDATYLSGSGEVSARFTGVLLWSLLDRAGTVDAEGRNTRLRHTLMVTGSDGYAVALALGEIDPDYEGKAVILAYEGGDPPASPAALRLVVPGDSHGGRYVRDVARIEVR